MVTNDLEEVSLHSSGNICIGKVGINDIKPSTEILQEIDEENRNQNDNDNESASNLVESQWNMKDVILTNDLQCMNTIISSDNNNELFLRFVHCPILHSRRNEILIINNHCEYIECLLGQLMKIKQGLKTRWMLGSRSIKGKIAPLIDNLESFNMTTTWQHEFKHNLLVGYVVSQIISSIH